MLQNGGYMLYIEGITKLYELKGFFTHPEKAGNTLLDISEKFIGSQTAQHRLPNL